MSDSRLARVLRWKPDRIAAAWRRVRSSERGAEGAERLNLLDGVVEPFIGRIGARLQGDEGVPWATTRGLLRISTQRGVRALYEEFGLLRRCLNDAQAALGSTLEERAMVNQSLDEAVDSAVSIARQLSDEAAPPPAVSFGGIVVEIFERPGRLNRELESPQAEVQ